MNICFITWEYPPRIVGGIARYSGGLARTLAAKGNEVHVLTLDFPGSPSYEVDGGANIHRVRCEVGNPNFLVWVFLFNHFLEKEIGELDRNIGGFDVIHMNDWMTAPVAIAAKHTLERTLVATMHSTEIGRSQGIHSADSYTIHGMEWWLTYEASRVIVCSKSMIDEVSRAFNLPAGKLDAVNNAIDVEKFKQYVNREAVRARFGFSPDDDVVLFVGRLTPQKGLGYLIKAIPTVTYGHPKVRLLVVGDGWMRSELEEAASALPDKWRIIFTGYIPDNELLQVFRCADVFVVPSVYEPFGIAALEGMAAGVPVVVSKVGGLAEIVEHDRTGVHVYPRNPDSIAWGIDRVLSDRSYAERLVNKAREVIERGYTWDAVADKTLRIYERALGAVTR
ncbi:MAG: glycosyltransferase family 4 protein [Aigarchaeota archaeon]|nr:glycosyltransferase family 4 protein [Aigarchaeota archaeon]